MEEDAFLHARKENTVLFQDECLNICPKGYY
jgi:hypothetical protein